ncbi:MAG TPA: isoaspartyl peptidase/L-asparaginase [Sandaracinaceae bacterium LLY-WYZ-13_1]|nr:isoaspartyl peptidase/L-asparaginase [Sandaracinaceae bacterium LLY-WYZ-13_1]
MSGIVPVVVVHGGAGDVPRAKRPVHAEGCKRAAEAAREVLLETGRALDAVIEAVVRLEADPLFNAGTGACLTSDGTLELDASVMEGGGLTFGAVASLPPFAHPIRIAEAVRADGRHACYAGAGAARFATEQGFEPADPEALVTEAARERLAKVKAGRADAGWAGSTVGAVACDARGRVAAATSTGGTVGKRPGRVGDTPIAGAGTWADDDAGACSATGIGEHIMRTCLSKSACDLLRAGVPAQEAADAAIAAFGRRIEGRGGIVVVGPDGQAGLSRNTATMSWALARAGEGTEFGF